MSIQFSTKTIMFTILNIYFLTKIATGYRIVWDNDVEVDLNEIDEDLRSAERRIPNWFFIFPGTKWCGAGNIAANDTDLGLHRDTDKCCRTHDKCPDIIEGYQTKYGLENPSFYTRLNCACDKEFYKCLKSVGSKSSKQVGFIYFTGLGTKCYRLEHPIVNCQKFALFPRRKCIEYILNENQPKKYQWFDVPNF
ncbi:phospholipase A2-like [Anthonomus grandis grandis]|uniref:phospholipase A2-like n=1 Tax=Anthonomus grandis grandis TaxID=2921223 RepID=UPI002166879C|nr:phospholipase A2-like [Anthonomus grandis grandis]